MPRLKPESADEKQDEPAGETLVPFSVLIDGEDRTVLARDAEDLKVRIARLKSA